MIQGLIGASLMITLPYTIALFPQKTSIQINQLEPELQATLDPQQIVYYNKGL